MVELNADPAMVTKAGDGINGVIDGLGDTGVGSIYTAGSGSGFGDLTMDGKTIGHADPQSGLSTYCQRWEWGVRALVRGARKISTALKMGASSYEREDKYNSNNLKSWANDVAGDPNLQRQSYTDANGNKVKGTDDMSAGELLEHNKNALTHPDWEITAADREAIDKTYEESWNSIKADAPALGERIKDPLGSLVGDGKDLMQNGIVPITEPAAPAPAPRD